MDMSREMYREHILDHYKHPHNFGQIQEPTHQKSGDNPLCGDSITIQLVIVQDRVKKAKFIGRGCAISIAAASLLTDALKGKTIEEIKQFDKDAMLALLMIPVSQPRMLCVLLPLQTVHLAIGDSHDFA